MRLAYLASGLASSSARGGRGCRLDVLGPVLRGRDCALGGSRLASSACQSALHCMRVVRVSKVTFYTVHAYCVYSSSTRLLLECATCTRYMGGSRLSASPKGALQTSAGLSSPSVF